MTTALKESVGRYGVWSFELRSEDPARRGELEEAAAELEELGYGAIWLGGNSTADHAAPLIGATRGVVVGTSIQSVWQQDAATTAAGFAELETANPGRFALGLGVSHGPLVKDYSRPYAAMVEYLDELDRAGVPAERRVLAALGPRMLELSRDRAAGAIPYLTTPEHTERAREILGAEPLLAPELKVVLETDPARARETARAYLARYLELPNYTNNFLRLGFTEDDVAGGGSDRLIDAVFAWGDEARIRERVTAFHEAGADHVALQVVTANIGETLPRKEWRDLAALLG
ncbi:MULTISPECIES: LLM class F420-dependent oxidoreductase [Streptomyces]|uniref:LLM class F420-dependent oxidoreductase n=1 Tax=Streptomyces eurythermus TaxID=42237 RepID=A0ABW6YMW1_9ACTN|nr:MULTISPECIES: LLM class F420-dependent oxidoreductase [Streptomyces]QIS71328.1 LLM class F420-dependent oxidoreductase [Streptomyces sp. DSM 40868]WDM12346.1 LLM class F420-dependent oxidoreductase [Streptomyces lavenduligriseus]